MADYPHYSSSQARRADLGVHLLGLGLAIVGGAVLLWLGLSEPEAHKLLVIGIYSAGVLLMFAFSTAYNFTTGRLKPFLRRLDHVGIFLMIAATYTPFTAYLLSGTWAWALTAGLWVLAGLGIAGKIFLPPISQKVWVPIYLGLAWIGGIAAVPLAGVTSPVVLWLLAVGGMFYSAGVLFYVNKRLQFARAIWHGHVVAAAATHWAAVFVGLFLVHSS
jgi:hemolysin III